MSFSGGNVKISEISNWSFLMKNGLWSVKSAPIVLKIGLLSQLAMLVTAEVESVSSSVPMLSTGRINAKNMLKTPKSPNQLWRAKYSSESSENSAIRFFSPIYIIKHVFSKMSVQTLLEYFSESLS